MSPGIERELFQFLAALGGPQLFSPAHALSHGQSVQLVFHRGSKAHQLEAVPQQLARVSLLWGGNPDARETSGNQQFQKVPGVPRVGLVLANRPRANFRRVAHPQLVPQFGEQLLEPPNRAGRFDAHPHRPGQTAVENLGFSVEMIQPPLHHFSCRVIQHGHLLIARVKIAAYNQHCSAPSSELWSVQHCQVYSVARSRRRYPINGELTGISFCRKGILAAAQSTMLSPESPKSAALAWLGSMVRLNGIPSVWTACVAAPGCASQ